MELFKTTQTDKRKNFIRLLKKNAPQIYNASVIAKKLDYENKLNTLREQYKNEKDEERKSIILSQANVIKHELEVYSV